MAQQGVSIETIHMFRGKEMRRLSLFRGLFYFCLLSIAALTTGCPSVRLVYPDMVSVNCFAMPQQWADRYITSVKVYEDTESSRASKEPVWVIEATDRIPAGKVYVSVGSIPEGFEQTVPPLPQRFKPIGGQTYYIQFEIEPADEDMLFILKPWVASSFAQIGPDEDDDKPYTHPNSKMEFPKYVGLFERGEIKRYDKKGNNISVAYYRPPERGLVEMTVYVYLMDDPKRDSDGLKMHFEECKETIEKLQHNSKVASEGKIHITQNGNTHQGYGVTFSITKQTQQGSMPFLTKLFLFGHGEWFIKYRVTYPEMMDEHVNTEIKQFTNELTWPKYPTE